MHRLFLSRNARPTKRASRACPLFLSLGFMLLLLSPPGLTAADTWAQAIAKSTPKYWYSFDETDPSQPAANKGSVVGYHGVYGPEITAENLGQASPLPMLGTALEFTGPEAGNSTGKYVDFAAEAVDPAAGIPELTNFRPPAVNKATTVEYWIKTTQLGSAGSQTWSSPSLLAHESPGDGDMYWGWINDGGDFGFSTSDLVEIFAGRDGNRVLTDGLWHHIILAKTWRASSVCASTLFPNSGCLRRCPDSWSSPRRWCG